MVLYRWVLYTEALCVKLVRTILMSQGVFSKTVACCYQDLYNTISQEKDTLKRYDDTLIVCIYAEDEDRGFGLDAHGLDESGYVSDQEDVADPEHREYRWIFQRAGYCTTCFNIHFVRCLTGTSTFSSPEDCIVDYAQDPQVYPCRRHTGPCFDVVQVMEKVLIFHNTLGPDDQHYSLVDIMEDRY